MTRRGTSARVVNWSVGRGDVDSTGSIKGDGDTPPPAAAAAAAATSPLVKMTKTLALSSTSQPFYLSHITAMNCIIPSFFPNKTQAHSSLPRWGAAAPEKPEFSTTTQSRSRIVESLHAHHGGAGVRKGRGGHAVGLREEQARARSRQELGDRECLAHQPSPTFLPASQSAARRSDKDQALFPSLPPSLAPPPNEC